MWCQMDPAVGGGVCWSPDPEETERPPCVKSTWTDEKLSERWSISKGRAD